MARIQDANSNPIFDDVLVEGTLAGLGDSVNLALTGQSGVALSVADIGAGVLTIDFEASVNGVDYFPMSGVNIDTVAVVNSTTANGSWVFACAGMSAFRARVTAWTSGSAKVAAKGGQGDAAPAVAGTVAISGQPISVDDNGGSLTVDGPLTDTELRASPVEVDATLQGTISANNSSNTPLGGGGFFAGTADDLTDQAVVIVSVE